MTSVWIYAVVSSDLQADSLPSQVSWGHSVAQGNGWAVDRVFEGVGTGKHGVRKLMHDLLAELQETPKARRPQRILMVRLDRTGRGDTLEILGAIGQIRKLGCIIHTRQDGDLKLETVADTMKPIFEAFQAGIENEVRSDRSRAGHERKRREGKHAGHAPYGTVLINGKPVAYEPEASIVREVFDLYVRSGWGRHRIAKHISAKAPMKRKADGSLRRMKWCASTIESMLKCQTLRATVVDETLFDAVQKVERRGRFVRSSQYSWPLRGILKCSCGRALAGQGGGHKERIRYYVCRATAVHGCYVLHRADKLEAQFVDLLGHLRADPGFVYREAQADLDGLTTQRAALAKELESIDARRSKTFTLAEDGFITGAELRERLNETESEKQRLETAIAQADRDLSQAQGSCANIASVAEIVRELAEAWPIGGDTERRDVARAVAELYRGLYTDPSIRGVFTTGLDLFANYQNCTELCQLVNRVSLLALLGRRPTYGP